MVGWHHWLDGHEFEQALEAGDGLGSLVCCSPWSRKESDMTEWLNWTDWPGMQNSTTWCPWWFSSGPQQRPKSVIVQVPYINGGVVLTCHIKDMRPACICSQTVPKGQANTGFSTYFLFLNLSKQNQRSNPSQSCPISTLLLLTFCKTPSCPKSLRKSAALPVRHLAPNQCGVSLNKGLAHYYVILFLSFAKKYVTIITPS